LTISASGLGVRQIKDDTAGDAAARDRRRIVRYQRFSANPLEPGATLGHEIQHRRNIPSTLRSNIRIAGSKFDQIELSGWTGDAVDFELLSGPNYDLGGRQLAMASFQESTECIPSGAKG
jgi:hypothetical protein